MASRVQWVNTQIDLCDIPSNTLPHCRKTEGNWNGTWCSQSRHYSNTGETVGIQASMGKMFGKYWQDMPKHENRQTEDVHSQPLKPARSSCINFPVGTSFLVVFFFFFLLWIVVALWRTLVILHKCYFIIPVRLPLLSPIQRCNMGLWILNAVGMTTCPTIP